MDDGATVVRECADTMTWTEVWWNIIGMVFVSALAVILLAAIGYTLYIVMTED